MRTLARACVLAALLAVPAVVQADPPARISIVAVFNPITYGDNAYVNGQLIGDGQGGQLVTLEQSAPPYTEWTSVLQTTSDPAGYYSFKLHPAQTMQYRTSSQGTPSEKVVQVNVAPRITLTASAAGRSSVRFSGRFAPALDGQSVAIQRRSRSGAWTTVTNAVLHGGKLFQGRLRAHRPVTLRARFASDGAHLDAHSNAVRAVPGGAQATASAAYACRAPKITRAEFTPDRIGAPFPATLRVHGSLPGGRVYAVDVRWGDGERDHFTSAPARRKPEAGFVLHHGYGTPGEYRATVRVYGITRGCKRASRAAHPQVRSLFV